MPTNLANAAVTPQDKLGVIGRPNQAKVTDPAHRMTRDDTPSDTPVSELFLTSVKVTHGKVEAGAEAVDKDRGNFTRDVTRWMETLQKLGPQFLAHFGYALYSQYGADLETAAQRAERLIDQMQADLNELRQYVRHIA